MTCITMFTSPGNPPAQPLPQRLGHLSRACLDWGAVCGIQGVGVGFTVDTGSRGQQALHGAGVGELLVLLRGRLYCVGVFDVLDPGLGRTLTQHLCQKVWATQREVEKTLFNCVPWWREFWSTNHTCPQESSLADRSGGPQLT